IPHSQNSDSPLFPPPGVPKERKSGRKGNPGFPKGSKGNPGFSEGSKGNSQIPEGLSPERLRILRHHLHLRSQGWLQDPAGNWVKDGNAEFDSDEEEPSPLPPA
ncbi:SCNM1 protein, partial [Drymodes brunneopygia]|nr:SCNM1 protein [Drymodes brunneopygia]